MTLAALQLFFPQRSLCVAGSWEKEKESAGGGGHDVLLFLGASAEERGSTMYRFLALNLFLLVAHPQIGSAYAKEGTMT